MRTKTAISTLSTAALITVGALGSQSFAATATANLAVNTSVASNCTLTTAPVAFGSYDPVVANASANLDATGALTVACTKGASPSIALALGGNASGSVRRLSDGSGNYLSYELYQEAARSTVWGTTGGALLTPVAAPSKAARNFTVYGRVPANQDVPSGNYADTVVATVNF